jgi:hypothetical protein
MRILLIALLFLGVSCGPHQVNVNGEVIHKIQIDTEGLKKYFETVCQREGRLDFEICVDEKMGDFFDLVFGGK